MTTPSEEPDQKQELIGADLIIPVAGILLAIYYFITILDSAWTARVTFYIVGITLIGVSAIYIFQAVGKLTSGSARLDFAQLMEPTEILTTRVILFALTLGSIIVMDYAGFTLTATVYLASAMLLLTGGKDWVRISILSVVLSIFWFVLFVLVFERRFPLGWLDEQIKALIGPLFKSAGLS